MPVSTLRRSAVVFYLFNVTCMTALQDSILIFTHFISLTDKARLTPAGNLALR
jgi:hypothetical protein